MPFTLPIVPVRLLFLIFISNFVNGIPAGTSVEERVHVFKFTFQLVVKLDGLKMCQLVQNSTESKTCGTLSTYGTAPSFIWG